jgi:transposase
MASSYAPAWGHVCKASFIPLQPQRDLRDSPRYCSSLKQERTRPVNRVHKLLEETNLKLSSVFADVMCKTGRATLHVLAQGEIRSEVLSDLALLRAPGKRDALVPALQGCLRPRHRFLLGEWLAMIGSLERSIERLDGEIAERVRHIICHAQKTARNVSPGITFW